jgi:HemK-like putative methylase
MTYREAILLGESILQKAKIVDAKNDAWLLLAMACRINHTYYYVHMDEEMSQEQIREYQALLSKRAERIPLQYIVGEQEFMGLKFRVNSNVLIPRQDTETLVEEALKVIEPGMRVLDMCLSCGHMIAISPATPSIRPNVFWKFKRSFSKKCAKTPTKIGMVKVNTADNPESTNCMAKVWVA